MRAGWLMVLIAAGVLLRCAALAWEYPHGDVLLDTAVARELADGNGFHSGFDRGTALARGTQPVPPQDLADQHPPLWPLLGAAIGAAAGGAFHGLQLASLLAGLLVLRLTWRAADRLVEGCPGAPTWLPALATALVASSFLMLEFSADGALYMAQAALVLLLAEAVAAPRRGVVFSGFVLGAAWLLNYQCAVLLAVPAAAWALASEPGGRWRAVGRGALAAGLACVVQVPWWWRNAEVFGDAFHSTNAFYPLNAAGLTPSVALEGGVPVARLPDGPVLPVLLGHAHRFVPPNVLYVALAGMLLWPGLLGVVAAGVPTLLRAARDRDRRLAALLLAGAALLSVSLLWPDLKLRYLVPLTPIVVLLGVRLMAGTPSRGERVGAWVVATGWLALLAGTWHDVAGHAADARPARWLMLAAGGVVLVLGPLLLRHAGRRFVGAGLRTALVSGLFAAPLLAAIVLLQPPRTSYHGNALLPDIFGKPRDRLEARDQQVLERARRAALDDGARVVCGPEGLMAFAQPALVTLPYWGDEFADVPLAALVDAGRCDHVITLAGTGWPDGLPKDARWLDGRLVVIAWVTLEENGATVAAATVSRVTAR